MGFRYGFVRHGGIQWSQQNERGCKKVISKQEYKNVKNESLRYLKEAGIKLSSQEAEALEIADFGLGRIRELGLQLVTYVNTSRYCAKELVLLPRQTCPEHYHPHVNENPGKEETFRCRKGIVYLYVPGTATEHPQAVIPEGYGEHLRVWKEIVLKPGEQYTILPETPHWFQAGDEGAVVSEFSSTSTDENDIFTDPKIIRTPILQ
ncbi:D-lyxose/D-mannose family sugar isomerase [Paenibacillus rhizophilus]|uniref:D-lyxose ketol-isomerase n=1 Tax=Paenibacillus rhizophilus TaxID=1850366 RepID=A0A3N9P4V5_9BACL|nr:D-lyxose/D-mannose family sugar isomerase [Paenibacillus rhizophilus]